MEQCGCVAVSEEAWSISACCLSSINACLAYACIRHSNTQHITLSIPFRFNVWVSPNLLLLIINTAYFPSVSPSPSLPFPSPSPSSHSPFVLHSIIRASVSLPPFFFSISSTLYGFMVSSYSSFILTIFF